MDYKVVFIPVFGSSNQYEQEVETLKEASLILNAIANYTIALHEFSIMPDYSNCGMTLKRDGDDWIEVDDDGLEI